MPETQFELPAELRNTNQFDLMMGRALPAAMLVTLLKIASLTEQQIQIVSDVVSDLDQLVAAKEIESLIADKLDVPLAESITQTLISLESENVEHVLLVLDKLRAAKPKAAEVFNDQTLQKIRSNLSKLLKKHPSVELIRKSQRLIRSIGNEIKSATFICDLRPVFDKKHEKVEGLISIANLKVGYIDQNDDDCSIEFALSEGDLDYLIERCRDAKQKMGVLARDYLKYATSSEAGVSDE